jgi:hypothetical protein
MLKHKRNKLDANEQTTTVEVDQDSARIIQSLKERAAAEGVPLDALLRRLADESFNGATEKPFYETATREEWLQAFNEWVDSHNPATPVIVDDSREAIYGDDGR